MGQTALLSSTNCIIINLTYNTFYNFIIFIIFIISIRIIFKSMLKSVLLFHKGPNTRWDTLGHSLVLPYRLNSCIKETAMITCSLHTSWYSHNEILLVRCYTMFIELNTKKNSNVGSNQSTVLNQFVYESSKLMISCPIPYEREDILGESVWLLILLAGKLHVQTVWH